MTNWIALAPLAAGAAFYVYAAYRELRAANAHRVATVARQYEAAAYVAARVRLNQLCDELLAVQPLDSDPMDVWLSECGQPLRQKARTH